MEGTRWSKGLGGDGLGWELAEGLDAAWLLPARTGEG